MRTLIPIDSASSDALPALRAAADVISAGDEVTVLHVLPAKPHAGYRALRGDPTQLATARARLTELCHDAGMHGATVRVCHGLSSIAREVAAYARMQGVDRVVVPTHDRQGLARMLWGSEAARIASEASVPVVPVAITPHAEPEGGSPQGFAAAG